MGLGFGVLGLGFGVLGLGFGVLGLGFGVLGFRVALLRVGWLREGGVVERGGGGGRALLLYCFGARPRGRPRALVCLPVYLCARPRA